MTWIAWILLGLAAGALAKFIMPGKDPGGLIVTMLIGRAGSFAGGFVSKWLPFLPDHNPGSGLPDSGSIITATIGAVLLISIYRKGFG